MNVVSSTNGSDSPSIPTLYLMLNAGIQSPCCTICTAPTLLLNVISSTSESASVTSVVVSAVHRAASRSRASSVNTAPAVGRKISSVSRLFCKNCIEVMLSSGLPPGCREHHDNRPRETQGHRDHQGRHVRPNPAGLLHASRRTDFLHQLGRRADRPITD